eukprot:4190518-Prymnesium_polylepis.1
MSSWCSVFASSPCSGAGGGGRSGPLGSIDGGRREQQGREQQPVSEAANYLPRGPKIASWASIPPDESLESNNTRHSTRTQLGLLPNRGRPS